MVVLTCISSQLTSSGYCPSIPLPRRVVRPGQLSLRRLHPPSLPASATACISLQHPFSGRRPSVPLAPHVVRPVQLPQRHLRPFSWPATVTPVLSSASAAPPLSFHSSYNNQPIEMLLETDGGDRDGGSSAGGAVGDHDGGSNRKAALMMPPREWDDWSLQNLPADSDASERFFKLEMSPLLGWLLQFGGIKERLLADDVLLVKVAIECCLEIFSEAMAVVADLMLVHLLPTPTTSLTSAILAIFLHTAISGGKHFAVGMASSMVRRTAVRNAFIDAGNVAGKSSGGEVEDVPILSAGVAYGVYMAFSYNLRSQVLDGLIEQRILEPLLHQHNLVLGAVHFAVRTGNTFLGSLLWTNYARLFGIQ